MVDDYARVLEGFMKGRGTRDLRALCEAVVDSVTWKTTPRLSMLLLHIDLFLELFKEAFAYLNMFTILQCARLYWK